MPLRPTVRAANGMVATGHHLATGAALAALRDGGSAADAAVAAAAVSAVVLPHATSIGGDCFVLYYDARGREVSAYNGSGAAPRLLPVLDAFPPAGAILATVPGALRAWADLLDDHGRLGWDRVLAAAIGYAEQGYPVSARLAAQIEDARAELAADPECARIFTPRGRVPAVGEILQQPDLAATLRQVSARGAAAFYEGELAERFAEAVRAAGGALAADDLARHRTDRPRPLAVEYGGLRVFGQPPVSQGHVLLEELAIAAGLELGARPPLDAELVHTMVEIKKLAFADRDAYAGDPAATRFDAAALLTPDFVAARRAALPSRASAHVAAGSELVPAHTTYLAVVDRDGNAVSLIESVFSSFGARVVAPGTGVLLNDRLSGFSLDPASPNVLSPGKRPVHTLNTVIALDGEQPRLVFGTPGRHAQVQTNFQLAVALIDHGMDPQDAIEQPRWYHGSGRTLGVEARFPEGIRRALAGRGHELEVLGEWDDVTGGAQVIRVEPSGGFAGGADPRREGHAAGY